MTDHAKPDREDFLRDRENGARVIAAQRFFNQQWRKEQ